MIYMKKLQNKCKELQNKCIVVFDDEKKKDVCVTLECGNCIVPLVVIHWSVSVLSAQSIAGLCME